jgi:ribosomal protein L11 methyltransferase
MVAALLTLRADGGPDREAPRAVDELSARCWALGCRGIEEIDGTLRVGFDDLETAVTAAAVLADRVVHPPETVPEPLAGWTAPMEAVRTGPFRVQPVDAGSTTDEDAPISLSLDPGLAFGSGSHPSTRVALSLLAEPGVGGRAGERVLDVGTGTGVLAIAAARLGARSVRAIDSDPAAVTAATANVARNRVGDEVEVVPIAAEDLARDVDEAYDLVLVNLTIDGHESVAPTLTSRLGRSGSLIASGVLVGDQETRLGDCYADLVIASRCEIDGWVGLTLTHPDSGSSRRPRS